MPKGVDTGNHPGRKVHRDRFQAGTPSGRDPAVYAVVGRGSVFDTGQGARPAFSLKENRELGQGAVVTGGPAGSVRRRGPRFQGSD